MTTIKVFTDIHGCYDEFERLLRVSGYNPDRDRLIFLGDYVDRGPKSLQVVQRVRQFVREHGAVALGGNHEEMFLNWVDGREDLSPLPFFMPICGGIATALSFLGEGWTEAELLARTDEARAEIRDRHAELIEFLRALPDYHEEEKYIFVHAGIDPELTDWHETQHQDFRWIRERFHHTPHRANKTVIFGHTPTHRLHADKNCSDIWIADQRIGVDGGCAFGYQLNCLEISEDGTYRSYSTPLGEK
jgi:serine/threonine protein phosphatase 1